MSKFSLAALIFNMDISAMMPNVQHFDSTAEISMLNLHVLIVLKATTFQIILKTLLQVDVAYCPS